MVDSRKDADPPTPDAQGNEFTVADFRAQLDAIKTQIIAEIKAAGLNPVLPVSKSPPTIWDRIALFFSSGIFFILLGLGLLEAAHKSLGVVHTSFSFVLVVLGVAILLFGTGTQGIGRFENTAATAKYHVALAGGAGVLAMLIGYGMVIYAPDIQGTFGIETKHLIAVLKPRGNAVANFDNYWAQFDIEGV